GGGGESEGGQRSSSGHSWRGKGDPVGLGLTRHKHLLPVDWRGADQWTVTCTISRHTSSIAGGAPWGIPSPLHSRSLASRDLSRRFSKVVHQRDVLAQSPRGWPGGGSPLAIACSSLPNDAGWRRAERTRYREQGQRWTGPRSTQTRS